MSNLSNDDGPQWTEPAAPVVVGTHGWGVTRLAARRSASVRHIVWDWNGTLYDDQDVVLAAVNAALDDPGAPLVDAEVYRTHYTRPVRDFYERVLGYELTPEKWQALDDAYHEAYAARIEQAALTDDARAALEAAENAGCTQSLLSMWRHDALMPLVRHHGLERYFVRVDGLKGSGGGRKERHLHTHLEALRALPRETLVVGDTLDDAHAAAANGTRCVLYDGGSHHREELESAQVPVVDSLVGALTAGGV